MHADEPPPGLGRVRWPGEIVEYMAGGVPLGHSIQ